VPTLLKPRPAHPIRSSGADETRRCQLSASSSSFSRIANQSGESSWLPVIVYLSGLQLAQDDMDYEQIMQRDYMVPRHQQNAWPRCCDWDASRLGVRSWRAMLSCGPDHQLNYSIPLQVWQPRNWVLACIYVPPFRPDYSHICNAIMHWAEPHFNRQQ
jgi:hypothetical protein